MDEDHNVNVESSVVLDTFAFLDSFRNAAQGLDTIESESINDDFALLARPVPSTELSTSLLQESHLNRAARVLIATCKQYGIDK